MPAKVVVGGVEIEAPSVRIDMLGHTVVLTMTVSDPGERNRVERDLNWLSDGSTYRVDQCVDVGGRMIA